MSWRIPTESDLTATLSAREIDAFRRSSDFGGADPVAALITRTAEFVRGFLRTGEVSMSPTAASIPEGLISPAMDYAAYDILKRMPVEIGRDRADARRAAQTLFDAIADKKYRPEAFGDTDDSGGGPSPAFSVPDHILD